MQPPSGFRMYAKLPEDFPSISPFFEKIKRPGITYRFSGRLHHRHQPRSMNFFFLVGMDLHCLLQLSYDCQLDRAVGSTPYGL